MPNLFKCSVVKILARPTWFLCLGLTIVCTCLLWCPSQSSFAALAQTKNLTKTELLPPECCILTNPDSCQKSNSTSNFDAQNGSLVVGNQYFHKVYTQRVCQILAGFGKSDGPVALLIKGDKLIVYQDGQRKEFGFLPPLYDAIKAISHQPLALELVLRSQQNGNLEDVTDSNLKEQKHLLQKLRETLNKEIDKTDTDKNIVKKVQQTANNIVEVTDNRIAIILAAKVITAADISEFRKSIIPPIVKSIDLAATVELAALNKQIKILLRNLSKENHEKNIYVVVSSSHQPRYQEISMQYFSQVLGEIPGNDAVRENRLIYAEGQYKEIDLLSLLARHILDREIAIDFFRDPSRMQRDLLSNSGSKWLWENQIEIPRLNH